MAWKLKLSAVTIIVLLHSCSSVKLLSNRSMTVDDEGLFDTPEKPIAVEIDNSKKNEKLEKIVDNAAPESQEDIVAAEEEIIREYENSDQKETEDDSVDTVAAEGPKLNLSYKKKHFEFWKKYFTNRSAARFKRHTKNGGRYKKVIESILEEEGLPKDLFYVGLIESGYNTHIRSRASAVGPWQFIKGTATRYGLRVDSYVDERRNIYKSTYAAAQYFKDLYNIFGSWELALCAYNKGEYGIIRAIRKGKTRDYQELVAKNLLPKETIYYIPKVAAAKELLKKHSFKSADSDFYVNTSPVEVEKSFSFSGLAKKIGVNLKTLKKLNPDVKRDWVRRRRDFILHVPNQKLLTSKKVINRYKPRRVASSSAHLEVHKVKRGESLYRIARKYKTSINEIKGLNNLKRNKIYVGQKLKVKATGRYVVRGGDNLSEIARKFAMSVRELKRRNNIRGSRIYVGQKLSVSGSDPKYYIVRRGDNLTTIARRFGTSVGQIVRTNSLKNKTIYPKQKIILPI